MKKELFLFSLPLFGGTILGTIIARIDLLMLGYFTGIRDVGLYNAALPIAKQLIPFFAVSMTVIYLPIISKLFGQNLIGDIKKLYQKISMWGFLLCLPFMIIALFCPELFLKFTFGQRYISAGTALRFLSIGFFIHILVGPNGTTLIALGKTKFVIIDTAVGAFLNIVLNFILIPLYGIEGAAIASAIALIGGNMVSSIFLYARFHIQPFHKNYLKSGLLSIITCSMFCFLTVNFFSAHYKLLPILFLTLCLLTALSFFASHSYDKEEQILFKNVLKKMNFISRD